MKTLELRIERLEGELASLKAFQSELESALKFFGAGNWDPAKGTSIVSKQPTYTFELRVMRS